jgi:hypothetical protein
MNASAIVIVTVVWEALVAGEGAAGVEASHGQGAQETSVKAGRKKAKRIVRI